MSANVSSVDAILAAEAEALKAATFRRLHPRLYLERFLAEGVRSDGRTEDDFRDIAVNVGMFHGLGSMAMLMTTRIDHQRQWLSSRSVRRHYRGMRSQS